MVLRIHFIITRSAGHNNLHSACRIIVDYHCRVLSVVIIGQVRRFVHVSTYLLLACPTFFKMWSSWVDILQSVFFSRLFILDNQRLQTLMYSKLVLLCYYWTTVHVIGATRWTGRLAFILLNTGVRQRRSREILWTTTFFKEWHNFETHRGDQSGQS